MPYDAEISGIRIQTYGSESECATHYTKVPHDLSGTYLPHGAVVAVGLDLARIHHSSAIWTELRSALYHPLNTVDAVMDSSSTNGPPNLQPCKVKEMKLRTLQCRL